jgi:AraC-like DNA-binding protein
MLTRLIHKPACREIIGQGVPMGVALQTWRDEVARSVLGVEVNPIGDGPFDARLGLGTLGRVSIGRYALSPLEMNRSPDLVNDGDGDLALSIVEEGVFIAEQGNDQVALNPGQGVVLDAAAPSRLIAPRGGVFWGIKVSPTQLHASGVSTLRITGQRLDREPALRLLRGYAATLVGALPTASAADVDMFDRHVLDLIGSLLRGLDGQTCNERAGVRAARRQALHAFIDRSLTDPDLSLASAAQALDMSERSIQALLAEVDTCFSDLVRSKRLERAFSMLVGDVTRQKRILTIAYDAGFQDVSTFNRLFRARYGITPRQAHGTRPVDLISALR